MNRGVLVAVVVTLAASRSIAESTFPPDVAQFLSRRDACDHFRGEYPYDEERRQFLERNTQKLCVGTDRQLAALKNKYRADAGIMAKLNRYEATIEPRSKQ